VLEGKISLAEAREAIQLTTRRYAKRQLTWFRKEQGVRWFSGFGDDPAIQSSAFEWLRSASLG
jgi:tRNA dimethylallyltransferase